MPLKDIFAQDVAVDIIRRAIRARKVPHAYLFSGPPGVGKFLVAKALAMTLNCKEEGDDACGKCLSCRKIIRQTHPDVSVLTVGEKKKRILIEEVRDLERRLITRPHEGRAKVVIIDPADAMTESAANALLKTLEEPAKDTFMVLVSSQASSLLATVRSRCQRIRFKSLPEDTVVKLLELRGIAPPKASVIAALSGGSMEQAEAYLSLELEERIEAASQLLEAALAPTPKGGLDVAGSVARKREEALELLNLVMIMLSEILWLKTHPDDADGRVLAKRFGSGVSNLARELGTAKASFFISRAHIASQSIKNNNMNPQLALEGMLMSMRGRADDGLLGLGPVADE